MRDGLADSGSRARRVPWWLAPVARSFCMKRLVTLLASLAIVLGTVWIVAEIFEGEGADLVAPPNAAPPRAEDFAGLATPAALARAGEFRSTICSSPTGDSPRKSSNGTA